MSDQSHSVVPPQPQIPTPPADAQQPAAELASIAAPATSPTPSPQQPADSVAPPVAPPAAPPEPIDHTSRDEEIALNAPAVPDVMIAGDNLPNVIQELPSRLYLAFLYLQRGYSVRRIAELMEVSRGTIYYWINNDPRFIAALRKWRALNYTEINARMAALLGPSLDGLEKAVGRGNVPAILTVIKHNIKNRIGATDEKVISARLGRRKKRQAAEVDPPEKAKRYVNAYPVEFSFATCPPDDSASHLVDASTIQPQFGQTWDTAYLEVENTSDRDIIATLKWEYGSDAPEYTNRIVLAANSNTSTLRSIYVTRGNKLTMTVVDSRYQ